MSVLTDEERMAAVKHLYKDVHIAQMAVEVSNEDFDAIEAAVIAKLAGVDLEPVAWEQVAKEFANGKVLTYDKPENQPRYIEVHGLYTATQLAAARVQEREACAVIAEDTEHYVAVRGWDAQLGDATKTQANIAEAIRSRNQQEPKV